MGNNTLVIDIDDEKEIIKGYNPKKAEGVHQESAKLADKKFMQALKSRKYKKVILMCGGSASGKSEFVDSQLKETERDAIIFDGTLSSVEGLKIKLQKARKYVDEIQVVAVIPASIKNAFIGFQNRKRQFDKSHFFRTHAGCRGVLEFIADNAPDVLTSIFVSRYESDGMYYKKMRFADYAEQKNYIKDLQTTIQELQSVV